MLAQFIPDTKETWRIARRVITKRGKVFDQEYKDFFDYRTMRRELKRHQRQLETAGYTLSDDGGTGEDQVSSDGFPFTFTHPKRPTVILYSWCRWDGPTHRYPLP